MPMDMGRLKAEEQIPKFVIPEQLLYLHRVNGLPDSIGEHI